MLSSPCDLTASYLRRPLRCNIVLRLFVAAAISYKTAHPQSQTRKELSSEEGEEECRRHSALVKRNEEGSQWWIAVAQ